MWSLSVVLGFLAAFVVYFVGMIVYTVIKKKKLAKENIEEEIIEEKIIGEEEVEDEV